MPRFEHWHFFIRKGGHVFGYGLLSILLFRAWRETLAARRATAEWTLRWANIAVLGTALVASLDEWHQSFLPSRTGTPGRTLVLDTCAGIGAQILVLLWTRVFRDAAKHFANRGTIPAHIPPKSTVLLDSRFLLLHIVTLQ